jgi:hypothetical protein
MKDTILRSDLLSSGFLGDTLVDALSFCELKENDYWVDCPVKHMDAEAKKYNSIRKIYTALIKRIKVRIKLGYKKI